MISNDTPIFLQFPDGDQELASIWDYDPPGDMASSGAWVVLRELATTLNRCWLLLSSR